MPVLNDFGDEGYARVVAQLDAFAAALGIPKEIIRQYWSDTAHLPQTLDELKAWGLKPDREYGQIRYDAATGRWMPLGTGPTPGKTDQERGGFPHFITNNVGEAQRFQQVDASGNIFAGSWDPAYNAAHPVTAPLPTTFGPRTGATASSGQGAVARTMENPYKGTPYEGAWEAGNPSGAPPAPTPTSAPGGGGAGGAPAAGSAPSGGSSGVGLNDAAARAANDAVLAFLAKRRLEEIDLPVANEQIAASRAERTRQDALAIWKQTYEQATLTGSYGGSPTLDATKTGADITGYTGGAGTAGNGQRVLDAMAALRGEAGYQAVYQRAAAGDQAAVAQLRAMEAARVVQATGGALTQEQALQAVNQMRATTATAGGYAGAPSQAAQIEGILRGIAPGTATLDRERDIGRLDLDREIERGKLGLDQEKEQNSTLVSVLNLLSTLRGPENAFAYANTLANVPESVRQNIQAAMGRLPVAPRNPAAAGVWNDVRAQQAQATAMGQPAMAQDQMGIGAFEQGQQGARPAPAWSAQGGPTASIMPMMAQDPGVGMTPASPVPSGTPPGFFPSMTNTTPIGVYGAQPEIVSGQPLMSQDPRGPAPAYGPRTQPVSPAAAAGLSAPNQWSPTAYNNTDVYARKLELAAYEQAGEDPESVQWRYQQSLPRAFGPRTGRLRAA